jgi:hypothetical protein
VRHNFFLQVDSVKTQAVALVLVRCCCSAPWQWAMAMAMRNAIPNSELFLLSLESPVRPVD